MLTVTFEVRRYSAPALPLGCGCSRLAFTETFSYSVALALHVLQSCSSGKSGFSGAGTSMDDTTQKTA